MAAPVTCNSTALFFRQEGNTVVLLDTEAPHLTWWNMLTFFFIGLLSALVQFGKSELWFVFAVNNNAALTLWFYRMEVTFSRHFRGIFRHIVQLYWTLSWIVCMWRCQRGEVTLIWVSTQVSLPAWWGRMSVLCGCSAEETSESISDEARILACDCFQPRCYEGKEHTGLRLVPNIILLKHHATETSQMQRWFLLLSSSLSLFFPSM